MAKLTAPETDPAALSFGARLRQLAVEEPGRDALVLVPVSGEHERVSRARLNRQSERLAKLIVEKGVSPGEVVVIGLPNCILHFTAAYAIWKAGACVLPLNPRLVERERDEILGLAKPSLVFADWPSGQYQTLSSAECAEFLQDDSTEEEPLPEIIAKPGKAIASGGSTGRSKIIVDPRPWAAKPGDFTTDNSVGMLPRQVQLVVSALYHNTPFGWAHEGLFDGHTVVLMEKFDAARAVDLIEQYRVSFAYFAPAVMTRIIRLPGIASRDFSSISTVFSTAAPCPPWLKRAWIDLLGPERVYEGFGAAEEVGACIIRGDEWLSHQGSVGRPYKTDLRILGDDGSDLPSGQVGEIYMRPHTDEATYQYIGSTPAKTTPDGYASTGDLGSVDADGYLYLADRRVDMIVTGGVNVYPAEVEAVLTEYPGVMDAAVVGLPDSDWGKRVHAVVELAPDSRVSAEDLLAFCQQRLSASKLPRSIEFVERLPRDEAGKIRRSALVPNAIRRAE